MKHSEIKIGDTVTYYGILGDDTTKSEGHIVLNIIKMPNNFGCDVAWISEKSTCVAIENLSVETYNAKPIEAKKVGIV